MGFSSIKLGNHFIVGFEGTKLTKEIASKLEAINPAGIIFYDTNIETKKQVKTLIRDLKNLLGDNLIVSTDQEGGKVQRLRKITSPLPSFKALGLAAQRLGSIYPIIHASSVLAEEMLELGFNLVYSPCADLNTEISNPVIGSRSLGVNVDIVCEQLKTIVQTYKHYGLMSCAKHYPGHGASTKDSHLDLPIVKYSSKENEMHLKPFKACIESGVDSIMMAHLIRLVDKSNPDLGDLPASINAATILELRQRLGFKGLIISDEITMKALERYGNYSELALKLIEAGNDLVIWNTNLDDACEAASIKSPRQLNFKLEKASKPNCLDSSSLDYIADAAIDWNSPKAQTQIEKVIDGDGLVIIYDHPKFEVEIFTRKFKASVIQYKNSEELKTKLTEQNKKVSILLFCFQALNNPEEARTIDFLRQNYPNLIVCGTDIGDSTYDLNLNGLGELHISTVG